MAQSLLIRLLFTAQLLMLVGSSCSHQEAQLSFQTIEQETYSGAGKYYEAREPGMIFIANSAQVNLLSGLVSAGALMNLKNLNYDEYYALAVFQGWKETGGFTIIVNRVTYNDKTINIYVQIQEPKPDEEKTTAISSPYHLIAFQKEGEWMAGASVNLIHGDSIIATTFISTPPNP